MMPAWLDGLGVGCALLAASAYLWRRVASPSASCQGCVAARTHLPVRRSRPLGKARAG